MGHAGDDRLARQLGAVEEEQQADADVGHPFEDHGGLAAAGQESGEKDGDDQRQGEVIRRKRGRDMGTLCRIGEHMAVFWLPGEPAL